MSGIKDTIHVTSFRYKCLQTYFMKRGRDESDTLGLVIYLLTS